MNQRFRFVRNSRMPSGGVRDCPTGIVQGISRGNRKPIKQRKEYERCLEQARKCGNDQASDYWQSMIDRTCST